MGAAVESPCGRECRKIKNLPAEQGGKNWGERRGTIPRQPDPQSGALPTELLSPENGVNDSKDGALQSIKILLRA